MSESVNRLEILVHTQSESRAHAWRVAWAVPRGRSASPSPPRPERAMTTSQHNMLAWRNRIICIFRHKGIHTEVFIIDYRTVFT